MSSNAYKNEQRREREAAYAAECREREQREAEHEQKFGALRDRLEELGINVDLLAEYLVTLKQ